MFDSYQQYPVPCCNTFVTNLSMTPINSLHYLGVLIFIKNLCVTPINTVSWHTTIFTKIIYVWLISTVCSIMLSFFCEKSIYDLYQQFELPCLNFHWNQLCLTPIKSMLYHVAIFLVKIYLWLPSTIWASLPLFSQK